MNPPRYGKLVNFLNILLKRNPLSLQGFWYRCIPLELSSPEILNDKFTYQGQRRQPTHGSKIRANSAKATRFQIIPFVELGGSNLKQSLCGFYDTPSSLTGPSVESCENVGRFFGWVNLPTGRNYWIPTFSVRNFQLSLNQ